MKLLIINYSFPPNPGIGGRRWAKFCKYLHLKNVDFEVLTFTPAPNTSSSWVNDTNKYSDKIEFINSNYPQALGRKIKNKFDSLRYKIALTKAKLKAKGNYYDKSVHCRQDLLKAISNKINNNGIDTVIVSVAPFRLAYFVSEIIDQFPSVKFIVDFRDPWTSNRTSYGFNHLNKERQEYEISIEQKVIKRFHKVLSVATEINEGFDGYTKTNNKFAVLPNGFDPADFNKIAAPTSSNEKMNLVFTGTFYNNTKYILDEFVPMLTYLKTERTDIYNSLKFDFYGASSKTIEDLAKQFDIITNHPVSSQSVVFNAINNADGAMLFLSKDITYSFSTKFCEYIALKKPVFVFSELGKTSEYVRTNKIGYALNTGRDMQNDFLNTFNDWKTKKLLFNPDFDVNLFSISQLTDKLIEICEE